MNRISASTVTRLKLVNGFIFAALGVFVFVQSVRSVGLRFQAASAYVLAAAMLALGIVRIMGARKKP